MRHFTYVVYYIYNLYISTLYHYNWGFARDRIDIKCDYQRIYESKQLLWRNFGVTYLYFTPLQSFNLPPIYLLYAICASHINQHARNECNVDANSSPERRKVLFVTRHAIKVSTHMRIALSASHAMGACRLLCRHYRYIRAFRNNSDIIMARHALINSWEELQLRRAVCIYQIALYVSTIITLRRIWYEDFSTICYLQRETRFN